MKITSFFQAVFRLPAFLGQIKHTRFLQHRKPVGSIVPKDFDWEFYLDFHGDLRQAGLQSKSDAVKHYKRHGFFEKRIVRSQDTTLIAKHEDTRLRQLKNISHYNEQQQRIIKNDNYNRTITVSVVVTVYNYAAYIDACLKTALNSTLKDIEIIIVNDCSTDESLSRCRAFLSCGTPITIIDKKINTGLAHSRNLGIQQAEGDYVFILDADNGIYPRCLEEHLKTLRNNRSLIACYAAIDMFDETGAFCGQTSNSPFNFKKLHRGNYIDAMAMFQRQALIEIGAYDEHLLERGIGYEDYELWLRIGSQKKSVGFIERPLSRYLKKQESMLSICNQYYHTPLMSLLRHTYCIDHPDEARTALLVVGMHRSGTSALTGLIGLMGADLGPDLVGPLPSNVKGHFEPRKIVLANDALLEKLGARAPGSGDLPEDWLQHSETKKTRAKIRAIILHDFNGRDLFVLKDPRLCLLLPLYRELFNELGIKVNIIVIRREQQEVVRSLNQRDGMPASVGRHYYAKHIKALEKNLTGTKYISVAFDHLIERPDSVIEQITACVPRLSNESNHNACQKLTSFIDPALRHHTVEPKNCHTSFPAALTKACRKRGKTSTGPDFLIIGAQRSGTTSLYQYLCMHPQILEPTTKELHWFHAGPREDDGYHTGHKSQQWYEKQLQPGKNALGFILQHCKKLKFEATPEYLFHPLIAEKVVRLYPATKIIVLLRDPLERAVSQYYHEKKQGFIEPDLCIEEYFAGDYAIAAEEEPKLINNHDYYSHRYEHCCPISRSNYGKQLDRWLRLLPCQQVLITRSEEMFRNPQTVLNTICSFLGLEPFPANFASKRVKCNNCERAEIGEEQRKKLTEYFSFDLSIEKFCTPHKTS